MSLSDPGASMTNHKLDVVRSVDGVDKVLIKHLKMSAAQEALFPSRGIYAGRCVSRAANGDAELGVTGNRVPYFLFRTSNLPSTGSFSDPTAIADAPGLTYQDGVDKAALCYASIEGIELSTTEFDSTAAAGYALNTFLRAPAAGEFGTDAAIVAGAGVLTSDGCTYGATPIVGIVSQPSFDKPHNINMLKFYGLYRPPIEGLPNGLTQPTWAV